MSAAHYFIPKLALLSEAKRAAYCRAATLPKQTAHCRAAILPKQTSCCCDYIATPRKSTISCDPEAKLGTRNSEKEVMNLLQK
ncbi:hypothetical protein ACSAZL_08410 [Methanosarcina sp. T3]|uniref:hypothetical protein n=1 Tax=Methanosarcina sp. T3 TaxID=3439062 RepID=UPI003F85E5F5